MKRFMRSPNLVARFGVATCAFCMVAISGPAHATLMWDWSFGDAEAGTFTTNGTLVDAAGSFNFAITTFTVTSSTVSSLVGQPYVEFQPVQGFLWNGVAATEFYRNSGSLTNGSNFYVSDPSTNQYGYLFYADLSGSLARLTDPTQTPVVGFSAMTLTPSAVPEPTAAALFGIGALALGGGAIRRSRKARRAAAGGTPVEAA